LTKKMFFSKKQREMNVTRTNVMIKFLLIQKNRRK
jgi:hypothetical protein